MERFLEITAGYVEDWRWNLTEFRRLAAINDDTYDHILTMNTFTAANRSLQYFFNHLCIGGVVDFEVTTQEIADDEMVVSFRIKMLK